MDDGTFTPGPTPNTVRAADGTVLTAPEGWALLSPGDAGLTRRVKAAGDFWVIQEKGFFTKFADQGFAGRPKRSSTRRRKWWKLVMPKARHRVDRSPWLNPSVRPLLDRLTK
jgi:hypothetical protein